MTKKWYWWDHRNHLKRGGFCGLWARLGEWVAYEGFN